MTIALYIFSFALMGAIAYVAIPGDVRALILENCKNSKGRFRFRYVYKEAYSVSGFYAELLFATALIAIVLIFGLIMIDRYIKLDIVGSAMQQVDWDVRQFKENLRSSPDNVEQDFTNYHVSQGGTRESAHSIMVFLWNAIPILLLLCFAILVISLRITAKVFNHGLQSLVQNEALRNRRRIQRRYLRSKS